MTMDMVVIFLLVAIFILLIILLARGSQKTAVADSERRLREDLAQLRQEINLTNSDTADKLLRQVVMLGESNEQRMEVLRKTVDERLTQIQQDNGKRLEEMRQTVDEKLQQTLEKRLSESFKQVSERLEQVHKGLGEMHSLAVGVGDLKKVLSNVRTRGTWGEVQLGTLLEEMLSPDQYAANVATKPSSPANRVEYAVRLPGKKDNQCVWLPIDAKFPLEDYQLLLQAQEEGNIEKLAETGKALEVRIKSFAKDVRDKYLEPPHTTDFALVFLPLEGLYSEILRRPGLGELLQREYRVMIAGPVTISALLNSLQMGFRTLAIEKRSDEVWQLLSAVKTSFGTFGQLLDKTQKKLQEASNSLEDASKRTRTIQQKLKDVSCLPAQEAEPLLGFSDLHTSKTEEDPAEEK